jgi:hypothetical protein
VVSFRIIIISTRAAQDKSLPQFQFDSNRCREYGYHEHMFNSFHLAGSKSRAILDHHICPPGGTVLPDISDA